MTVARGTIVRGEHGNQGKGHSHLAFCPRCGIERRVRSPEHGRRLCADCQRVDPKFGQYAPEPS